MEALLYASGAIIAAGGAATVVWKLVRFVIRNVRRFGRFLDNFLGDSETGQLGLMDQVDTMRTQLAAVQAELHPNGGGSLRDSTDRIERQVTDHINDRAAHRPREE